MPTVDPAKPATNPPAFLGAEDTMMIGTDVGHAIYSAVPAGLAQSGT